MNIYSLSSAGLYSNSPVNDTFFALRYNGQGHDFDVYGTINALEEYEKQGKPVRIFGAATTTLTPMGVRPERAVKGSLVV